MAKRTNLPDTPNSETPAASLVSVRNYPAALCRVHTSQDGSNSFHSISFIYQGSWASFILEDENILPSTRRNGEEIPDHVNLTLGAPDDVRFVSVKSGEDEYDRIAMFNKTIMSSITNARQAYLKSIAV